MKKTIIFGVMLAVCLQIDAMKNDPENEKTPKEIAAKIVGSAKTEDQLIATFKNVMKSAQTNFENIQQAVKSQDPDAVRSSAKQGLKEFEKFINPNEWLNLELKALVEKNPEKGAFYHAVAKEVGPATEYLGNGIYANEKQGDILGFIEAEGNKRFIENGNPEKHYKDKLRQIQEKMQMLQESVMYSSVPVSSDQEERIRKTQDLLKHLSSPLPKKSNAGGKTTFQNQPRDEEVNRFLDTLQRGIDNNNETQIVEGIKLAKRLAKSGVDVFERGYYDISAVIMGLAENGKLAEHLNDIRIQGFVRSDESHPGLNFTIDEDIRPALQEFLGMSANVLFGEAIQKLKNYSWCKSIGLHGGCIKEQLDFVERETGYTWENYGNNADAGMLLAFATVEAFLPTGDAPASNEGVDGKDLLDWFWYAASNIEGAFIHYAFENFKED